MAKIRNAFNVFAAEDVDLTPVRFDPAVMMSFRNISFRLV